MVTKELLEYIKKQREAGNTDEELRAALAASGWGPSDIDAALKGDAAPTPTKSVSPPLSSAMSVGTSMPPRTSIPPLTSPGTPIVAKTETPHTPATFPPIGEESKKSADPAYPPAFDAPIRGTTPAAPITSPSPPATAPATPAPIVQPNPISIPPVTTPPTAAPVQKKEAPAIPAMVLPPKQPIQDAKPEPIPPAPAKPIPNVIPPKVDATAEDVGLVLPHMRPEVQQALTKQPIQQYLKTAPQPLFDPKRPPGTPSLKERKGPHVLSAINQIITLIIGVSLVVLGYIGMQGLLTADNSLIAFVSNAQTFSQQNLIFFAPAYGAALLFVLIALTWGMHIYRKEAAIYQGLILPSCLYFVLSVTTLFALSALAAYAGSIEQAELEFAIGLIASITIPTAANILYLGFVLFVSIYLISVSLVHPVGIAGYPYLVYMRRVLFFFVSAFFAAYLFGWMSLAAEYSQKRVVCEFIYSPAQKALCLSRFAPAIPVQNTSTTTPPATGPQEALPQALP